MAKDTEKEEGRTNKKSTRSNDFRRLDKSRITEQKATSSQAQASQKSKKEKKETENERMQKKVKEAKRATKKELELEADALAEHEVIEACMKDLDSIHEGTKQTILEHSAEQAHDLMIKSRRLRQARTLNQLLVSIELGKRARARSKQKADDKDSGHEDDADWRHYKFKKVVDSMQDIDEEMKKTVLNASREAEEKRLQKVSNMAYFKKIEDATAPKASTNKEKARRAKSEPKSSSSSARWPQQEKNHVKKKKDALVQE